MLKGGGDCQSRLSCKVLVRVLWGTLWFAGGTVHYLCMMWGVDVTGRLAADPWLLAATQVWLSAQLHDLAAAGCFLGQSRTSQGCLFFKVSFWVDRGAGAGRCLNKVQGYALLFAVLVVNSLVMLFLAAAQVTVQPGAQHHAHQARLCLLLQSAA